MKLGFLDLIQSQFTLGLTVPNMNGTMLKQLPNIPDGILANMPQQVHDFLAFVSVEELHTAYDDAAVVYTGKCRFNGDGKAEASPAFKSSNGSLLQLQDLGFGFRITIPRLASQQLKDAISANAAAGGKPAGAGNGLTGADQQDFNDLFNTLRAFDAAGPANPAAPVPSDYPNISFRIELLFNTISLHLPADTFLPAKLNANGWLEKDKDYSEVRIDLPKIGLTITQAADNYNNTQVRFNGWGADNMDGGDAESGEAIRMTPALCLHSSGVVGFGLEKIVLDLSADFTPPEILEKNFGIGDDFTGLWIPSVRLFIAPSGLKGLAVDTWAKDMLIDFEQGLSGEFGVELLNGAAYAPLQVQSICYTGSDLKMPAQLGADVVTNSGGKALTQRTTALSIASGSRLQLRINGGKAAFNLKVLQTDGFVTMTVAKASTTDVPAAKNNNPYEWLLSGNPGNQLSIYINVTDQNGNIYEELMLLTLMPAKASGSVTLPGIQSPVLAVPPGNATLITLAAVQPDDDAVYIVVHQPGSTVTAGGNTIAPAPGGAYRIPCARNNTAVPFEVTFKGATPPPAMKAFDNAAKLKEFIHHHDQNFEYVCFDYDSPGDHSGLDNPKYYKQDSEDYHKLAADYFLENDVRLNANELPAKDRLAAFLAKAGNAPLQIRGYASYEYHNDIAHKEYNEALSLRRANTLQQMLLKVSPGVSANLPIIAQGDLIAIQEGAEPRQKEYEVAVVFYPPPQPAPATTTFSGTVKRPSDKPVTYISPADITPPPAPPERSPFFRRMAAKVRFQRSKLVLAELNGQLDFGRQAEVGLAKTMMAGTTVPAIASNVTTSPGASADKEHKGMVDFRLAMVYNEATRKLTQTLELGFDQSNQRDGLLSLNRIADSKDPHHVQDTLASLLLFAPLLMGTIDATQSAQSTIGKVVGGVLTGAELIIAGYLGQKAIHMDRIILFGAQLSFTETSPDIWINHEQSIDEVGIIFDYGVQFAVNMQLGPLTIRTNTDTTDKNTGVVTSLHPPFVRYKAIGMKVGKDGFTPVFDTSKGYEISLGDPGALQIMLAGKDIGSLLKVLAARVARENPFLLEMDLALSINIGIISVDTIRVSAKVETGDNPSVSMMVVPSTVSVNIPGTLTGSGYLDIGRPKNLPDTTADDQQPKVHDGFKGHLDLTLVPLKLRISASLGIGPVEQNGRHATAFFLGLEVQLPTAIPLGGTGVGIYGILGLFGMHYKRSEPVDDPNKPGLPPALRWFDETVHGDVIDIRGWQPELDRWSFGLGVILGTMEGGFVLNMKGMFMLELPGPRILIFVKAVMLFPKPKNVKNDEGGSTAGILAVIDLDFNIGRLTIGLIMQYEIQSVLSLRVPVDAEFNFDNASHWHVYIGSKKLPAEATILGIVRGYAYLMISGNNIDDFPNDGDKLLRGFSLAVGLGASLVFGSKSDGLYLEVTGDFKAGVGFSPLTILGDLVLRGELHLWPVSVSAHALLTVKAASEKIPNSLTGETHFVTHIHGEACAKVDLVLFEVEGCVTIDIGPPPPAPPPASLIKGVTLVSRSTALVQGQGTDRPIDGALGRAVLIEAGKKINEDSIPTVSIDAIIALDLIAAPDVSKTISFTDSIVQSPTATPDYWIDGGDNSTLVRYTVKSIALNHPLLIDEGLPRPASWWQQENTKGESGVSLALLSWLPDATPHAVQQSDQLTKSLTEKWGTSCQQAAPAAPVFWTFNKKPLGYSTPGWKLKGGMWPDPPNTVRSTWPSTEVYVYEPSGPNLPLQNRYRVLAKGTTLEHTKVIGGNAASTVTGTPYRAGRVLQLPVEHALLRVADMRGAESVPANLASYFKTVETECVNVECKPTAGGRILLALDKKSVGIQNIVFRSLGDKGAVLEKHEASDYTVTAIHSLADLPAHWSATAGPWYGEVSQVMSFFAITDPQQDYALYLVDFKPATKPARFSITAHPLTNLPGRKAVLLCAIELTEAAEIARQAFDQQTQYAKQDMLTTALEGDKKRALLATGTRYQLDVTYTYEVWRDGKPDTSGEDTQSYVFKTDAVLPRRIDPWVIGITPQNDMKVHFTGDPVQIFFNDESALQLFKAYGHDIKAIVRKANGNHPPQDEAAMTLTPDAKGKKPAAIQDVPGTIKSAFNHALDELAADLPCITAQGDYKEIQVFTLPLDLERNTSYTIDIESKTPVPFVKDEPYAPLYKLAFTTSRYRSREEMASIICKSYVTPRVLKAALPVLASQCTDNDMQEALITAGLDALEPATDPRVMLLWGPDGDGHKPVAVLLDTPEPMWRSRPFACEEIITDDAGKDMKHWVMKDRPELEILPTALATTMARNPGGTRTVFYLADGAAGHNLSLLLAQNYFVIHPDDYAQPKHSGSSPLLSFTIPVLPPWADNND